MIYKGINLLCSDPTPLRKRVDDYKTVVSAYLSLKKIAPLCHHPTCGEQKTACTEQVELAQSQLTMAGIDLNVLHERHRSIIQRIADLEEILHLGRKVSVEERCRG